MQNENPIVIWRLLDGKPGHENQTLGLVQAMQKKTACVCYDIKVGHYTEAIGNLLTTTWGLGAALPPPDLIFAAGHATHMHALAAKRVYGGKTVILMRPSLPVSWFDLCLIPAHDHYRGGGVFLETRGVLNTMQPEGEHQDHEAIIMVGGPSKHFEWDDAQVLSQLYALVRQNPHISYTLTTSRRTPLNFLRAAQRIALPNWKLVPFEATSPGWVKKHLSLSHTAWVTEDSVSMVYEALTARVAVGLVNLIPKSRSRVVAGVHSLVNQNLVTRFDFSGHYQQQLHPVPGFVEASRCSDWILHHWIKPQAEFTPIFLPVTR